jgi:hypothetical protein
LTDYSHTSVKVIAAAMLLSVTLQAPAATIFSDSFESPDTSGRVTNSPAGWVSTRTDKTGINDASVADKTGSQYAYVDDYPNTGLFDGALTTTSEILSSNLTAWMHYTLTCDVTVSGAGGVGVIDLLAGTNVIASVTNAPATANNFSSTNHPLKSMSSSAKITIIPDDSHPCLGQTLAIRLRKVGGAWNADVLFDNLILDAVDTSSDTNAPTPNTMLWHSGPVASANTSITMTATNATDDNHVQYFFTNTVNGNVSGWISYPVWTDTGLSNGVTYTYKVKARDNSSNHNETAWSDEASVQADSAVLLYESFEAPSHADVLSAHATNSQGWIQSVSSAAGLHDEVSGKFTTPFGSQAAYVHDDSGSGGKKYSITNMGAVLEAGKQYLLSFNAAAENNGPAGYGVDLLAGTNVVATATGSPGTIFDEDVRFCLDQYKPHSLDAQLCINISRGLRDSCKSKCLGDYVTCHGGCMVGCLCNVGDTVLCFAKALRTTRACWKKCDDRHKDELKLCDTLPIGDARNACIRLVDFGRFTCREKCIMDLVADNAVCIGKIFVP